MEGIFVLLVLLVLCVPVIFANFTYEIAKTKGRGSPGRFVAGLFLGPLAMLAVGLMEPKSIEDREQAYKKEQEERP